MNINSSAGFRGSNLDCKEGIAKENSDWLLVDLVEPNTIPPVSFSNDQILFQVRQLFFRHSICINSPTNLFGNYTLGADYDINKNNSLTGSVRFEFEMGIVFKDGSLLNFNVFLRSCRFNKQVNKKCWSTQYIPLVDASLITRTCCKAKQRVQFIDIV